MQGKSYGVIGTNQETIDTTGNYVPGENERKMNYHRRAPKELAQPNGDWALPVATLEQTRLAKLAEINAGYESVMGYVQSGYPDKEVLSWERQATQARELKAHPDAEASFVRTLAAVKDVPVQEMADRIINNAENWEPVAAMLTAQRQLLEEAAYLAVTVEEVQTIKVSYTV